jgi:hypothetical protein
MRPGEVRALALAFALSAAVAGSGAALAQAASPAKKELVQKILKLQQPGFEGVGNQLAGQTANQAMQAAAQALAGVPADKRDALAKDVQAEVRKFYDEVAPILRERAVRLAPTIVGTALEEKFSEDELKTLITWLESPVSRKYQQFAGDLQQALAQKVVAESRAQVEPKLKALDQSLTAKLTTAGGSPPKAAPAKPAAPRPASPDAKK